MGAKILVRQQNGFSFFLLCNNITTNSSLWTEDKYSSYIFLSRCVSCRRVLKFEMILCTYGQFPRTLEVTCYKHLAEGIVVKTLGRIMIIANRLQVECSCCYMICALGLLSRVIRIEPPPLQHFIGPLGFSCVILDFILVLLICHCSKNCTAKQNKVITWK